MSQFRADPDNAPAMGWDCICLSFEKAGKRRVKGGRLQPTKERQESSKQKSLFPTAIQV